MFTKIAEMLSPSIRRKEGFTLIELLIVVAIIAILAAIAIPQFAAYRRRGYNASANSDLRNIRTSEEAMFADFQDYGEATVATGTGGSFVLVGANTNTVNTTVSLSPGVGTAVVSTTPVNNKNTDYIAKTVHASGDQVYGADSDVTTLYRKSCTIAGACANADRDSNPAASVSGTDDFSTAGGWNTL